MPGRDSTLSPDSWDQPDFVPQPSAVPACDFCSKPGAVVFYTVTEYLIPTPIYDWFSGDRFYACPSY